MSAQTASSNAINWHSLDDQPPPYTAQDCAQDPVASDLLQPLSIQFVGQNTFDERIVNMSAEQDTSASDPPLDAPPAAAAIIAHPNFHPDDYVEDNDRIPASLLAYDTWLPDPPCAPPKTRSTDFKALHPKGNAVLTYDTSDASLGRIDNLDLDIIKIRSPLIAAAFEASEHGGGYCLHLDALSPMSATPFARYLYIGSYAEVDQEFEEVPSSLLLHSQLHYLGALFDMTDLQAQALVNVIRQCEFACFSHDQPIDLCDALRFCYDHHAYCQKPIDNIIAYCIARFEAHKLGKDSDFLLLAYEHEQFRSDMARALVERNFQDEAAIDLIRLPSALADSTEQSWTDTVIDPRAKAPVGGRSVDKQKQAATSATYTNPQSLLAGLSSIPDRTSDRQRTMTLILRSKHAAEHNLESEHESTNEQTTGGSPHKRRKSDHSVGDDFVLITRPVVPSKALPIRTIDERSRPEEDGAFVLLSDPEDDTSPSRRNMREKNHNNSSSSRSSSSSDDLISFDVVRSSNASESDDVQPSSPRSDSSWVLT